MTTSIPPSPPDPHIFAFIDDTHPFSGEMRRFRERLAVCPPPPVPGRTIVSSEIRGRPLDDGQFLLDRFYSSMQHWSDREGRFTATSLHYDIRDAEAHCYQFPDEPYLSTVAPYLASRGLGTPGKALEVLRYVPLRRFTFRAPRRDGANGAEIGKFKRRSRLDESFQRMAAVAAAVEGIDAGFGVPAPGGVDTKHSVYFQDDVAGVDLATAAAKDASALETAAEVLGALHSVTPPALPAADGEAFRQSVLRDLAWIAFHRPALADLMHGVRQALADPPALETAVLAHGDFVASHVLRDGEKLTVIDLDLAHIGDRYRELAIMLASLPTDAPTVTPDVDAIVGAYERRAGLRLDRRRLAWHRLAAEVYYLALAFSKDRPIDESHVTTALAEFEAG